MNKSTIFGGWAVSPEILKKVFGDDADYIDVNRIMPKLFDAPHQLKNDWVDVVINEYQFADNPQNVMGGWSTGAMFAYAAAQVCNPEKLILLSATPCFCRKDDFRFGTRPAAVDQMINALGRDKNAVLQSFYERCGLAYDPAAIPNYTIDELSHGLMFLKQADLRPLAPPPTSPTLYHGTDDLIIPVSASKYFCDQVNGNHIEQPGGHAFFIEKLVSY